VTNHPSRSERSRAPRFRFRFSSCGDGRSYPTQHGLAPPATGARTGGLSYLRNPTYWEDKTSRIRFGMSVQLPHRKSVSVLLISVVIFQVACRGWIEKPIVPDTGIGMPQHGLLRVTKTDGAIITLRDFVVRNDSIVGFFADGPRLRAAVARTDVSKIEVRGDTTPPGVRIAGKAYLGVLAAGAVAFAVILTVLYARP